MVQAKCSFHWHTSESIWERMVEEILEITLYLSSVVGTLVHGRLRPSEARVPRIWSPNQVS